MPPAHPFDTSYLRDADNDDKLKEECGVFGVIGVADASNFVALGLHALQHRGQEAGGIVSHDPEVGFQSARRFGYVRDNFTSQKVMETLPGILAIGHVRYSTAGSKGQTAIRDRMHHPLDGTVPATQYPERMEDALRRVEGAFSIVAMTRTKLIGVRDPLGVRPLVLGQVW
ncbi:Amidophosphoribosyltransferase [Nymphon striatum]|nr:Amidophosphoribosyltransferase [Nymphon striatum]